MLSGECNDKFVALTLVSATYFSRNILTPDDYYGEDGDISRMSLRQLHVSKPVHNIVEIRVY